MYLTGLSGGLFGCRTNVGFWFLSPANIKSAEIREVKLGKIREVKLGKIREIN